MVFGGSKVEQEQGSSRSRGRDSKASNTGNNIHVSGLNYKVDSRDLENAFAKVGRVTKASVVYDPHTRESRQFGFVMMETSEEADAAITALNGTELMGKLSLLQRPDVPVRALPPQEHTMVQVRGENMVRIAHTIHVRMTRNTPGTAIATMVGITIDETEIMIEDLRVEIETRGTTEIGNMIEEEEEEEGGVIGIEIGID
ncbi:RNA-binding domain-containing protein [Dendrothele bispora CBS 962.96]|uniref:RNA-binding domain-containing protein n=1 Tax=Dendrothele bispora (strain CBS 962.96) TaxID=1314807 RepID=A0A4S8MBP3_DENBC|nr:RNA-binding domain-containing protein [Dendrothele bispora CBS 962.96]